MLALRRLLWLAVPACLCEDTTAALAALGIQRFIIIHLERAQGRHDKLLEQANSQGLAPEVLNASDGRAPRFRSHVFRSRHRDATCADIVGAIFDSHRRAWAAAAKTPGHTVIFEDDVILPDRFARLLVKRFRLLPATYHLAMLGTTTTPAHRAHPGSHGLVRRPDEADAAGQAILGFYSYMVSQAGARRLLELHDQARQGGARRIFQPVDLFVSHRLRELEVYLFAPPPALAEAFRAAPHPSISSHVQLGLTGLRQTPSMNAPLDADEETQRMRAADARMKQLFQSEQFEEVVAVADGALHAMDTYPCWSSAMTLQNMGLAMLRLITPPYANESMRQDGHAASALLSMAREVFTGAIRYAEGTWMERSRREQIPGWIAHALAARKQVRAPLAEEEERVHLGSGAVFFPTQLLLTEPEHADLRWPQADGTEELVTDKTEL